MLIAADRQTSSEVQRGVALQPFGLACLCVIPPSCGLSAMSRWGGALKFFEAVGQACRVGGRVCLALMRPTSHAVSKRLGAALLVLVRALLSSYRSYDWCQSIRPMTPEMWLDLEPIPQHLNTLNR